MSVARKGFAPVREAFAAVGVAASIRSYDEVTIGGATSPGLVTVAGAPAAHERCIMCGSWVQTATKDPVCGPCLAKEDGS